MEDRFNEVTEDDLVDIDQIYEEKFAWQDRNGVVGDDFFRYSKAKNLSKAISTVRDVQILLSFGWEFEAEYNGYVGFIGQAPGEYFIGVEKDGKLYEYRTPSLDEFGENAKFGPYPLKDVVDKWNVPRLD